MKIETYQSGKTQEEVDILWNNIAQLLIDKYNIPVFYDMDGPTGMNIINGKKRTMCAYQFKVIDWSAPIVAALISQRTNSAGNKVIGVAPYLFVQGTIDTTTFHPNPSIMRIGLMFEE